MADEIEGISDVWKWKGGYGKLARLWFLIACHYLGVDSYVKLFVGFLSTRSLLVLQLFNVVQLTD